jgi:hypothetical protein
MNNNFFDFDKTLNMLELLVDDIYDKTKKTHTLLFNKLNNFQHHNKFQDNDNENVFQNANQYLPENFNRARLRALNLIATKKRVNKSALAKQKLNERSLLLNRARKRAVNILMTKQRFSKSALAKQKLNNEITVLRRSLLLNRARKRAENMLRTKQRTDKSNRSKQKLNDRSRLLGKARKLAENMLRTKQRFVKSALAKQKLNNKTTQLTKASDRARKLRSLFQESNEKPECRFLYKTYPTSEFTNNTKKKRIKLIH